MKKIFLLLLVFLGVSYGDNAQRISDIQFEIKSLEDQKPIIFEVIKTCTSELPALKSALKEVKTYREQMDATIDSNIVKTVIGGGINAGFEILGGFSGGKFVELGTWIAGKAIGVGMEKSSTFGGVAYYKNKVDGISAAYKELTPELDKLSKISKSSDEAMKSYYNKYGKYSKTFGLGDAGVFTQRMRLIVGQANVAANALEILYLKIFRALDEAERDMRNLQRQIEILKEELDKLNDTDKAKSLKETKEKKLELSEEDKQAAIPIEPKSHPVQLSNMPKGCYEMYKTKEEMESIIRAANDVANKAHEVNKIVKDLIDVRYNEQSAYLLGIKEKYTQMLKEYHKGIFYIYALDGDAHEKVKKGLYPTGKPFSFFLTDTQQFGYEQGERIKTYQKDLKLLTDEMLLNIPTSDDERIMQNIKERDGYIAQYATIHSECFKYPKFISLDRWSPSQGIVNNTKALKREYLHELEKINSYAEKYPKWLADRMQTLETYFAKRRGEMQEERAKYEKEVSEQDAIRSKITGLINKVMRAYEGNDFTQKEKNSSYSYIPKTQMKESVCKTISALYSEFRSGTPSIVMSLEKNIIELLKKEKYYGTSGFPIDAYIEVGADTEKLSEEYSKRNIQYSLNTSAYYSSRSNLQAILSDLEESKFYQLGLFYPKTIFKQISDKQMQALKDIKSSIQNFKVQTKNSLDSNSILDSTKDDFEAYYKHIVKMFKDNFGCLPLNHQMIDGLLEEIEDLKQILSKLGMKQTYIDASSLIKDAQTLYQNVENFGIDIDNPKKFLKDYQAMKDEHDKLYELVNTTFASTLFELDKRKLNELLLEIGARFGAFEDHKKFLSEQGGNTLVENLYRTFAQEYSNKNLSSLMSLISDDWQSQSDGTTLMDLEDTLGNSFNIFNEIRCDISGLSIQKTSPNTFRVSYVITIEGLIYDNDIKHTEKSSVSEEVTLKDGKVKISKTYDGRFWQTR